jgi:hypothetical protein
MSFLSVLKTIGHVLQVGVTDAKPFLPIVASVVPGAAPIVTTVLGAIGAAESLIPQEGAGAVKKSVVTTITNAAAPGIDQTTLSSATDEIVAALNKLAAAFAALETAGAAALANPPAK